MKENQLSLILVLFYIPYGIFNVPATLLAQRYSPGLVIPLLLFCWGIVMLCSGAVKDFGGVAVTRLLLGIFEAGFYPTAIYYCTMLYPRLELGKRVGYIYSMVLIANAFSGLLAYRIFVYDYSRPQDWRLLFFTDGTVAVFFALCGLYCLPRDVVSTKLLDAEEKRAAAIRYAREVLPRDQDFRWSDITGALKRVDTWVFAGMGLSYGVACISVSNFLPILIRRLGYSVVRTQLFTIPPNITGAVVLAAQCFLSDSLRIRSLFIIAASLVSIIAFILLGTYDVVHDVGVGYFCIFLMTIGTYTPAALVPVWLVGNTRSATARVTKVALLVGCQNLGGIIASLSFRAQDAPVYKPALVVSGVFQGMTIMLTAGMAWVYWKKNKNLERTSTGEEEVPWRNLL